MNIKRSKLFSTIIVFSATLLHLSSASARRNRGVPAQTYFPALDAQGFLSLQSPLTIKTKSVDFIFNTNYTATPLVLDFSGLNPDASDSNKDALNYITAFNIGISLCVFKDLQVSLFVPVYKLGTGTAFNSNNEWGFTANDPLNTINRKVPSAVPGDTRLSIKYNLFDLHGFAAGIRTGLVIPFGVEEVFAGEQNLAAFGGILLGYKHKYFTILLNSSYYWRQEFSLLDPADENQSLLDVGPEIQTILGIKSNLGKFAVMAAVQYFHTLSDLNQTDSPRELLAGIQYSPTKSLEITVFAGSDAYTGPEYGRTNNLRFGLNLAWTSQEVKQAVVYGDKDGDGINDNLDECPDEPEDIDGFEDADGCPDPDNDQDGIPDKIDKCPMEPEDLDDFEDKDGCPDSDNDGDGIPDVADRCPGTDKETENNFYYTKEDFDGFQDDDGCPDFDNDGDGIPDSRDKCPNEAETFNGIDDEDGCPDIIRGLSIKGGKIEIEGKIEFENKKTKLKQDSIPKLLNLANLLKANPGIRLIRIEVHTDGLYSSRFNKKLSGQRAAKIRNYLMSKGVAPYRLQAVGYGENFPVTTNRTKSGRSKNRRIDFIIVYQ